MSKKEMPVQHGMAIKRSTGDRIFDVVNTIILVALCFVTLYPMWYVLCASFTENSYLVANQGVMFWPHGFTTGSYRMAFTHPLILSGYKNILIVLGVSLPINIFMTLFCGYFLSCKGMMWKKPIMFMIMFTMFFGGGMIPAYLNIRSLGLYNTLWALILPGAISVYNCIICRTFFLNIPKELEEAAEIDGSSVYRTFFQIVMPVSKALLGVMVLYFAVGHWNSYFTALIYINNEDYKPLQLVLRNILVEEQTSAAMMTEVGDDYANERRQLAQLLRYSVIVVSAAPMLMIYPFLQKYFDQGVMIGSVKG